MKMRANLSGWVVSHHSIQTHHTQASDPGEAQATQTSHITRADSWTTHNGHYIFALLAAAAPDCLLGTTD